MPSVIRIQIVSRSWLSPECSKFPFLWSSWDDLDQMWWDGNNNPVILKSCSKNSPGTSYRATGYFRIKTQEQPLAKSILSIRRSRWRTFAQKGGWVGIMKTRGPHSLLRLSSTSFPGDQAAGRTYADTPNTSDFSVLSSPLPSQTVTSLCS